MENENRNEIKNLNENEVEKVAGGMLTGEEIKKVLCEKPICIKKPVVGGIITCRERCRVCGKPISVSYARPPMKGCPDCICSECAKKRKEKQNQSNSATF